MKLIIEEYQYNAGVVREILKGLDTLESLSGKVSVNYVGYYYNPHIKDCVFILPKVLLEDVKGDELVFGKYNPEDILDVETENGLDEYEKRFIYEFAVWVYRTIAVFRLESNDNASIVYHRNVIEVGRGRKRLSNTFLDIILSLVDFNRRNRDFFFFIARNIHSGYNRINWPKTIAHNQAVIRKGRPVYINPLNRKKQINFDEELLVIFFSILNYLNKTFGFRSEVDMNYELITGSRFDMYLSKGLGMKRLKQIKYKYFSDKALELWNLCFTFFEQSRKIIVNTDQLDYLLVKNFNIVFEAIIDNLIGDSRQDIPAGLKDQQDGKRVDHMYSYKSLTTHEDDKPVYYIGDSKYYKRGNEIGKESVYKQFTYARNVIQWNLNLFMDEDEEDVRLKEDRDKFRNVPKLRDELTEGYNIIPNFFISGTLDKDLSFQDTIRQTEKKNKWFRSIQFKNRLFDRDTLLVCHYDVNFLYVVSLYAKNNSIQKDAWKKKVREIFRKAIQGMLKEQYDFFVMKAYPHINAATYIHNNFKELIGKIYAPYSNREIFSLALDKSDPDGNNERLLAELRRYFFVEPCELGINPASVLQKAEAGDGTGVPGFPGVNGSDKVLIVSVDTSRLLYKDFVNNNGRFYYTEARFPSGWNIMEYRYLIPYFSTRCECTFRGYYAITGLHIASAEEVSRHSGQQVSDGIYFCLELGSFVPLLKAVTAIEPNVNGAYMSKTFDELAVHGKV